MTIHTKQRTSSHTAITPDFAKQLFSSLKRDVALLEALKDSLTQEHTLLLSRKFLELNTLYPEKNKTMKALYDNRKDREDFLTNAGLEPRGALKLIQAVIPAKASAHLATIRETLSKLIQENAITNQNIAKQLHRNRTAVQKVMDQIQGKHDHSTIYGPKGNTSASRDAGCLAQA